MERVDLKLGFYCNNQCKFCVQGRKRDYLPAKETDEIINSLEEAYTKNNREVVFTGGEPTMHPHFLEMVKCARDIGFEEIQIQTNGRMFAYRDFCIKTIKAGATQFSPSLHGCSSEIHDDLTCSKGSFDQTVQGIKNLRSLNQFVLVNSVITSSNYKTMPELAKLFVDLDVNHFQFAFIHIAGTAMENQDWIVPRKTDILPYLKAGIDIGVAAGKIVRVEAIPFCFMEGYEEHVSENYIPKTRIYDAGFVVKDYSKYRKDSGKSRGENCKNCKYFESCEGPWAEYPDIFGWDEFKPVK